MDGEHAAVMDIVSDTFDMPAETMFLVFDNVQMIKSNQHFTNIEKLNVTSAIASPLDNDTQYKKDVSYALLHFDNEAENMSDIVTDIREQSAMKKESHLQVLPQFQKISTLPANVT